MAAALAADGTLDVPVRESEATDAPVTEKLKLYSASKALVIGIDAYTGPGWFATDRWPKLSKGIEDAVEIAKSLEAKGFKVTLLKDLGSEALKSAMEDFFIREGADPEARLLIWFAGHGHTIRGEGYLVPADAPLPTTDEVEFRRRALSLRRFGEFMRQAQAKHVLAVFDSCFAGTIFDVARALPPRAITRATGLKVRQFVSSGDADQVVSDNGRFRRIFIDALDGKESAADPNGDGFITGSELGLFLSDKITNLSEKGQTPRYGKLIAEGYDRGDFVLEKGKLEAHVMAKVSDPSGLPASGGAGQTPGVQGVTPDKGVRPGGSPTDGAGVHPEVRPTVPHSPVQPNVARPETERPPVKEKAGWFISSSGDPALGTYAKRALQSADGNSVFAASRDSASSVLQISSSYSTRLGGTCGWEGVQTISFGVSGSATGNGEVEGSVCLKQFADTKVAEQKAIQDAVAKLAKQLAKSIGDSP